MEHRKSGILMHITSLPSPYGIGNIGEAARKFVDFLQTAGQSLWQILPIGHTGFGDSPYQCFSAAAGSPYLIDPGWLLEKGLLTKTELDSLHEDGHTIDFVDYGLVTTRYPEVLQAAFRRIPEEMKMACRRFAEQQKSWIGEYALFMALKDHFGGKAYWEWEDRDIAAHKADAVEKYRLRLQDKTEYYIFIQYVFYRQWNALRNYAADRGIELIGDLPIYVASDSCEMWSNPLLFQTDARGRQNRQAGVPPDYFSSTGQLWGNPVYDWNYHKKTGYAWWLWRVGHNLKLFDRLRLDHFRGFLSFWEVPYPAESAAQGRWILGPGEEFLEKLAAVFGKERFIAEDLGILDSKTRMILERSGFRGMRVLTFGLRKQDDSTHLPHHYQKHLAAYTATHDSETIAEFVEETAGTEDREFARAYLRADGEACLGFAAVKTLFASCAELAIVPLQDVLSLGGDARMNKPAEAFGNWRWRVREDGLNASVAEFLNKTAATYKRNETYESKNDIV